ncbi:MAG TPA: ABC transporter ATP-binding protein [Caulobacteraceae bacterium]|nr:ABC transporter ATP-binding protein [Caulobacteraceae bacterium]
MSGPIITFEGVSKRFGEVRAVDDVTLEVGEGEFFALLGPSGCGKTTLLRMLAGFETPSAGRILIDGKDVAHLPPNKRSVNMVFQSYAVFPHMSVAKNVAYGLEVEGVRRPERDRRVAAALALVKLEGLDNRRPDQLSGGQRQRVALARALVKRPRVLLLDEPLSALDAKLREQMRLELAQLQGEVGVTFLFVTHDQDEALALASRCAVMDKGRLQQVGSPADLYERPVSRFVADFIGQVNLFEGRVQEGAHEIASSDLARPIRLKAAVGAAAGATVWAALRPERIAIASAAAESDEPAANAARGVIRQVAYLGSESIYRIELEGGREVRVTRANAGLEPLAPGEAVRLSWLASAPAVLLN